ncbi:MAG: TPM domain-containing protein [Candidatus Cloacimonadales bacterium]
MKHKILLTTLIVFSCHILFALAVPALSGRINDQAGILSAAEESNLENLLRQNEAETSAQIAVLTVKSLQGENLEDYSMRVVEAWGLGQKDRDNGVLLLIALQEKKIRLEVGYGLESSLTDLKSGYIIRNIISAEFKRGNLYGGIAQGLTAVSQIISGESDISPAELQRYEQNKNKQGGAQIPIGFIVFIFMILAGGFRGRRGGLFTALLLGNMLGGSSRGSSGMGGGGFGGFSGGGGSFGGGGASGGW